MDLFSEYFSSLLRTQIAVGVVYMSINDVHCF